MNQTLTNFALKEGREKEKRFVVSEKNENADLIFSHGHLQHVSTPCGLLFLVEQFQLHVESNYNLFISWWHNTN
jgi:hypothetical protein